MANETPIIEKLNDRYDIESHVASARASDFYRAVDRSTGTPVNIWTLRHSLPGNADVINRFVSRMRAIESLRLQGCPLRSYGVDPDGIAYALFPLLDAAPIFQGNLDVREAERRFTPCLAAIERLHQAQIVCGDIGPSSFLVDRGGRVLFIGVMGSFDVEASSTTAMPPIETLQFLAPEQRAGGSVVPATDVYALGVLGYRMFAGKYPFGDVTKLLGGIMPSPDQIPSVASLNPTAPSWCDEVFKKCFNSLAEVRYADAGQLSRAILDLRSKALHSAEAPLQIERSLTSTNISRSKQTSTTHKPLESLKDEEEASKEAQEKASSTRQKILILGTLLTILAVSAGLFWKFRGTSAKMGPDPTPVQGSLSAFRDAGTDPSMKAAIEVIGQNKSPLAEKAAKFEELINSDDPLAHDVLVTSALEARSPDLRELSEKAVVERVRRMGALRSSEQLRQWLRVVPQGTYPEAYQALMKVVNPRQAKEVRESELREAYATDPRVTLRIAAAIALDSKQVEQYHTVLAQLIGDSLGAKDAASHSALALILSHPELGSVFGDDVIEKKSELPDSDLGWVLSLLANRNDLNVKAFAALTLERGKIAPLRRLFLQEVSQREDLPNDVLQALVRAGAGLITPEDVGTFGRWFDGDVEKILLSILADKKDPAIVQNAFEILAAKSLSTPAIADLVNVIRTKYWEQRAILAHVVGLVAYGDLLPSETVNADLEIIQKFTKDPELLNFLAQGTNTAIAKVMVNRYGEFLGLPTLLKLLRHPDKDIRITVVRSLKDYNDIGALKLIINQYELEQDESVKKVYKETFWMIAEREKKQ